MATFQLSPPSNFDFSKPEEWPKWVRRFERFRISSGLVEGDQELQVNTLVYAMGDKADDIISTWTDLEEAAKKDYAKVKDRFGKHFVCKINIIFERAKFNSRRQEEDESADSFITTLYILAETCAYGPIREELIRDRIVVGLRDSKLSYRLQMDSELTLAKAVDMARQSEIVIKQQPLLRSNFQTEEAEEASADAVHARRNQGKRNQSKYPSQKPGAKKWQPPQTKQQSNKSSQNKGQSQPSAKCGRCGNSPGHSRQNCPAAESRCRKCKRIGHWESQCRVDVSAVHQQETTLPEAFLGEVSGNTSEQSWMVDAQLGTVPVRFKIDTGADVTVISESTFQKCETTLSPPDKILRGPGSTQLDVMGRFTSPITVGTKCAEQAVYVVKELHTPLLGKPAIEALKLIARADAVDASEKYKLAFPKVFEGLGSIPGEYTIQLKDDAKPFSLSTARRVPLPLLPAVTEELKRMEELGVISPVSEPTDWCAGMVVAPRKNGKVRICVDLTKLNESVRREKHPLPTVEHTLSKLSGAKVFSKLDANSGFWQIPLAAESKTLTTFITPVGRFCFNRLPFGISSAPEHFQRRMSSILEGLEGVVCLMDDILIYGPDQETHDQRVKAVLTRLAEHGATLNVEKCAFDKMSMPFLGQIVSNDGIRPDPQKVQAIKEMKSPQNVTEVRRFLGMANQLAKFSLPLVDHTKPLRELLEKDTAWTWDTPQQAAFEKVKEHLTTPSVLAHYDPNRETVVSADASSYGLGACLMQKQDDGEWRAVAHVSRALTDTEQRYAQIEKEALAATWACERYSDYLLGMHFQLETDHKPLVPLLGGSKSLAEMPPRIQRFRLRLMRFSYTITHVPGKNLMTADALSRAPVSIPTGDDIELQDETAAYVSAVVQGLPASPTLLQRITLLQEQDPVCRKMTSYSKSDWPERNKLSKDLQPYWPVHAELSVQQGLLMRGSRLVIPPALRGEILSKIHAGHLGLEKCQLRAKESVWWPGITKDIQATVEQCGVCLEQKRNRPEPLLPSAPADRPWQKLAIDLFEWNGSTYVLVVDYYSRYPELSQLVSTSSKAVVRHLKPILARHGTPDTVVSDNGPQFASHEFKEFAAEYGFVHITSSPRYPQSNGAIERCVQTIKARLTKSKDPNIGLMEYRATPLFNGYSPAQLLFGRQIKTTLPVHPSHLVPKWPDFEEVREKEREYRMQMKRNFDQRHRVKELSQLKQGDRVIVRDTMEQGIVHDRSDTPRSYRVTVRHGLIRRNRRDLVQVPADNAAAGTDPPAEPAEAAPAAPDDAEPRYPRRQRAPPAYLRDYQR